MSLTVKRKLILSFLIGLWTLVVAESVRAESLTVVVENVHSAQGTIMLQILNGAEEFDGKRPAITSIMQRAVTGQMTFNVHNLPSGEYAVRVMHDLNDNGELDANFVGMPNEPWAFSNNAVGNFGPPTWKDVRFALQDDVHQTLRLNR